MDELTDMTDCVGLSRVKALAMTWGEYCVMRGCVIGDDDPDGEGYLIEVPGLEANCAELFDGNVSWVTKAFFEKIYRPCERAAVADHAYSKAKEAIEWATRILTKEEKAEIANQKLIEKPEVK